MPKQYKIELTYQRHKNVNKRWAQNFILFIQHWSVSNAYMTLLFIPISNQYWFIGHQFIMQHSILCRTWHGLGKYTTKFDYFDVLVYQFNEILTDNFWKWILVFAFIPEGKCPMFELYLGTIIFKESSKHFN